MSRSIQGGLVPAAFLGLAAIAVTFLSGAPGSPVAPMGPLTPRVPLSIPASDRLPRQLLFHDDGTLRDPAGLHGIALGLFSRDPRYDYIELLAEIRATGASWVSLTCNYYQEQHDSTALPLADPRTVPWPRLVLTIRHARALGLRVMLFPILLLQQPGEDHWRGTIAPTDRGAWYRNYRQLVLRLAAIAEQEGVEILSVGSEFNSMQGDTEQWRSLIAAVRQRYSGALTYSVNWDTVTEPRFLDALDLVGMTTYFSLTDRDDPTVEELTTAWRRLREDIVLWQAQVGRPLIFTEVGFASQDGANKAPWNYFISERVDLAEQRDCFEAFTRTWRHEACLSGVFFYNFFGVGGPEDTGYTPRGKPALEVIRRWFPAPSALGVESTPTPRERP